jgi:glycosyltransferase involved in cell wall biosynthesis
MNKIKLSVIIPTYNRKDLLEECLCSLFKQTYSKNNYEIIIVDDGSTDDTEHFVKKLQKDNKLIKYYKQKNKGPAAARNRGAYEAQGELLLFADSDCVASEKLIEKVIGCYKKYPEVSACAGQPISFFENSMFYALSEYYKIKYDYQKENDKIYSDITPKVFINSNVFSIKKSCFKELQGFNVDYKCNAGEDLELGYRLLKNRYSICVTNDFFVYHHERGSCIDEIKRWYCFGFWECFAIKDYFKKHLILKFWSNKIIDIAHFPITIYISVDLLKVMAAFSIFAFYYKIGIFLFILYLCKRYIVIRKKIKRNSLKIWFLYDFLTLIRNAAFFCGSIIGSIRYKVVKF